ncbi:hypothetical protein IWW46_005115, partial [Coemansia sp. RSA 2440]
MNLYGTIHFWAVSLTRVKISPGDPISSCKLPFGMSYGAVLNQGTAPMAIYSHTVVFGDGLCSSSKKVHYYTILRNYLAWGLDAASGLGKSLDIDRTMKANNIGSKSYKMNPPENPLPVVQLYGGNLYAYLPVSIIMSSSTTISPSSNITDPTDPVDNSEGEPSETATDNDGSDSDNDSESELDTGESQSTSENSPSEQESVQPSGIISSGSEFSTTIVEITSYVTITTYSSKPASSAPASFTDGGNETGSDISCTDETVRQQTLKITIALKLCIDISNLDSNSDDETQTDDDSSVSGADSSPNNDNQESGGISRTTAILVGILVPLAIIIII